MWTGAGAYVFVLQLMLVLVMVMIAVAKIATWGAFSFFEHWTNFSWMGVRALTRARPLTRSSASTVLRGDAAVGARREQPLRAAGDALRLCAAGRGGG